MSEKFEYELCLNFGGNSPIIQVLSRELRSELGIAVFIINCGAFFGNQAVKDTVTPGNVWDFHGGEMETSMVLAERPETVKLETSEAGIPKKFMGNKTFTVYGPITLGWVSEEWSSFHHVSHVFPDSVSLPHRIRYLPRGPDPA